LLQLDLDAVLGAKHTDEVQTSLQGGEGTSIHRSKDVAGAQPEFSEDRPGRKALNEDPVGAAGGQVLGKDRGVPSEDRRVVEHGVENRPLDGVLVPGTALDTSAEFGLPTDNFRAVGTLRAAARNVFPPWPSGGVRRRGLDTGLETHVTTFVVDPEASGLNGDHASSPDQHATSHDRGAVGPPVLDDAVGPETIRVHHCPDQDGFH
jgi:hypothetical protein